MSNLDSILKSRDITLPTKVRLAKAMVFLVRTKLKPGQALRGRLGLRKAEALGIPAGSVARPIRKKIPVAPHLCQT